MNNQLSEFFVTFTTNGLTELKDGLKDLNIKMDNLNTSFTTGASKGDSFFGKFVGWGLKLTALAAGFASVGKAIKDAFNIGSDIIALNTQADAAGVKAEQIEALAWATAPYLGGKKDISAAGNFFENLAITQTKAWRGQYAKSLIDEMAYAGGITIRPDASKEEWMYGIADLLHYYEANPNDPRSAGARLLLSQAFGGMSKEQMLLFSQGRAGLKADLAEGMKHLTLSGEDNLTKAMQQAKAKMEFEEAWQGLDTQLVPLTTGILNALTTVVSYVSEFISKYAPSWDEVLSAWDSFIEFMRPGWEIVKDVFMWLKSKLAGDGFASAPGITKLLNTDPVVKNAFIDLQAGTITPARLADMRKRFEEAGILTPELRAAFENEQNRMSGQGWALLSNQTLRSARSKLGYDPNLKLFDVLVAANKSAINTMGNASSLTNNNSANVTMETVNVYGDKELLNKTQSALNNLQFQPSVQSSGVH